jgi:hypothetical protein
MTEPNKIISDTLGIEYEVKTTKALPIPFAVDNSAKDVTVIEAVSSELVKDEKEDYNHVREVLKRMIDNGESAMEYLKSIAESSEHPRAFEVYSQLMRSVTEASVNLYDLQEKTRKTKQMDNPVNHNSNITVDKAVFVGTSTDLLKQIKEIK